MKCSLIIPAYFLDNSFVKMTNRCVKSVGKVDEVIVVDDGSPVFPNGMFKRRSTRKLIRKATNEGYCAAANLGLRKATGDILIVGNNDLVFSDGWLEALIKPLDEGYDISTVWTSDQKDVELEDKIEDDAKFGSLFAMKRKVYETLGGFDEQFRDYFGDLDLHRRASDARFKIGKNLNFVVQHEAKATYKKVDPTDERFVRGQRLYEAKWGFLE